MKAEKGQIKMIFFCYFKSRRAEKNPVCPLIFESKVVMVNLSFLKLEKQKQALSLFSFYNLKPA